MATDYAAIRAENIRRYGTDIGRIGSMLLANRYDDRTHFIYELLQNAEDAFAQVVRIQNPAGRARTFTFDRGWISIAEIAESAVSATKQNGDN